MYAKYEAKNVKPEIKKNYKSEEQRRPTYGNGTKV